jgi:hypothetical protein
MLRRGYRAKLINNCMHLSSATELDTAKVVGFPSAQLTLMQCESRRMPMRFALRRPAEPCDSVIPNPHDAEAPSVILFRGQETHPRSILKAISWRTLGTLDTFAIMGTALSTANPKSGTAGPLQTGGPVSRN